MRILIRAPTIMTTRILIHKHTLTNTYSYSSNNRWTYTVMLFRSLGTIRILTDFTVLCVCIGQRRVSTCYFHVREQWCLCTRRRVYWINHCAHVPIYWGWCLAMLLVWFIVDDNVYINELSINKWEKFPGRNCSNFPTIRSIYVNLYLNIISEYFMTSSDRNICTTTEGCRWVIGNR
jgi:hypothetical protein